MDNKYLEEMRQELLKSLQATLRAKGFLLSDQETLEVVERVLQELGAKLDFNKFLLSVIMR